jgi:recombination protein RecA
VAPPFREAEFDIMFYGDSVGISREGSLIDMGVEHELVEKSGAWYSYDGERIGQGRENSRVYLRENPALAAKLETQLREALDIPVRGANGTNGTNGTAETEEIAKTNDIEKAEEVELAEA